MTGAAQATIHQPAERPLVKNQDIFDALWAITAELKDKVFRRFTLLPDPCSAPFQPYGGGEYTPSGFLSTFAGPEIDWLVYAWMGTPDTSHTNMHLTIHVGSQYHIPHFGFALGTTPDVFMYLDYLPRVDIWADVAYADKYLQPVNDRFMQLRSDKRFTPFVSQDMSMRLYQSPTSHCYLAPPTDETLLIVRETAHEMLDRWLSWFEAAEIVPEAERAALSARDLAMRQTICDRDPANAMADNWFGKTYTAELVRTLWGGNRTLPRAR